MGLYSKTKMQIQVFGVYYAKRHQKSLAGLLYPSYSGLQPDTVRYLAKKRIRWVYTEKLSCKPEFVWYINLWGLRQSKARLQLVDGVIKLCKKSYPEVSRAKKNVLSVIFEHEVIFQKTLAAGKRKIQKYLQENKIVKITKKEKEHFKIKFGIPHKLIPLLTQ